ncbi:glycoside hydrolase family 28 protein [Cylindrobasidium torrendii FP15055 ss-10]|uniref:Glycoside hydrolase family 28 protein n=1 Tax=Cylindrobasidium torrendii FP15055 ss-10 TaxID=1314674 RepID=A0A0D7BKR0_9AGAR|nr:glycoside hydrolase family 28 protein [Cylindrobasidium torrendii FP15055 ss-10]
MILWSSVLVFLASVLPRIFQRKVCFVYPSADGGDDTAAILSAFKECGRGGRVEFGNETYHIESVMNLTDLEDCTIDVKGTLLWGTDINYWLENSYPIGYQNQSSAWLLGGTGITLSGHGYGTIDGNGQVWYDFNANRSNLAGRPHALTIVDTKDSIIEGMHFVQPQMWTMTIMNSSNVLLQDIYVNATSSNHNTTGNTDGANTVYSDNITFRRWVVDDGDDCIAVKANSTNILIEDSVFYHGHGIAIGSIGQFPDRFERIENVTARNITYFNTGWVFGRYLKTWTGEQNGYPPNGGGGGQGFLQNATLHNTRSIFAIDQCISYIGAMDGCDTSLFSLENIHFEDIHGTSKTSGVFQCSGAAPCTNISLANIDVVNPNGERLDTYQCVEGNMKDTTGISCSGPPTWDYIKYVRNHDTERD